MGDGACDRPVTWAVRRSHVGLSLQPGGSDAIARCMMSELRTL